MHHKRGRAKNQRAGCLWCKPHKANGVNEEKASVERQTQDDVDDLKLEAIDWYWEDDGWTRDVA